MSAAVLLIAHGSRLESANADLLRLEELLAERLPQEFITHAFLELAEPTIPQGFQACVDHGATRVRMLPWFLSAGAHVSHHLEEHRRRFQEAHPNVECQLCPPLGVHPQMVDVVLSRLEQAV
jgi:sirohydrochlorin ferrochelatase